MATRPISPVIRFIHRIAEAPVAQALSDGQLLDRFAAERDEAAFAALVQRHGPLVLSVCRRVLHQEHDAEDAFQATFLVLVQKARSISKQESVGSWLYGVAYRIALKARATAGRRRLREQAVVPPLSIEPVDEVVCRELSSLLDEEVQRLPEKYRTPLLLCCILGKSTEEAARDLGWPKGTIGTRIARGREMLRTRLARRGLAFSTGLVVSALAQGTAEAMPLPLVTRTIESAVLLAASKASAAAVVSPQVFTLVKGALQAMMFTKLKIALAVAIAVAFVGTGTSLVSNHALNASQPAPRKSEARQFLAKVVNDDKHAGKEDEEGGEEVPNRNVEADGQRSANNLKQIGLAMHSYHDAHGHFPTSAIYGKNDKPLLSWRVAVLPYLDNEKLHEEFKLDEPWDSAHNKKLLEKMPSVFSAPGIKTKKPYTTYYQLIVGKGAMFEGMVQMQIQNITDGTSNTLMAVEAEKPVPWTKPVDLTYDPEKPLPKLGGVFADGFNLLVADGAVRFTKKGFDEKTMRAVITRAGGERVGPRDLDQ